MRPLPASRSLLRTAPAAALALAAAAALSGCVVAPLPARGYGGGGYVDHGYYNNGPAYDNYGGSVVVDVAPPPPRYEVITPAPALGWLWIGGYWGWRANQHYWNAGHWEAPRAGYRYVPHAWEPAGRGWRERPGRWDPR
ncbi:hypothetical protein LRH25_05550 [Ideonella azotifigens]|uniref:YXWGXW repeat-containing protein n=1 Tax=Ideonella azotifigens TaxID=513160 RepID=A0ABP3UY66_9BURK|nr:hypothetical protein [Ideonella azotifigens]